MKKSLFFALILLIVGNGLWCDLQEHYKKGKLVLKADDSFGQGNDWEELFYDPYKDMVVAPDGSIFVANSRAHNVFKFDKQGNFVKKFGRKGEGPGDFYYPGDLSILDDKYLVVGEYAARRRFSLWHLNGKLTKMVKTQTGYFHLTALRDNRVSYIAPHKYVEKKNGTLVTRALIIKDVTIGKEKNIKKITLLDRSSIDSGDGGSFGVQNFTAEVYLARTINGNLAVGVSDQTKIDIYSINGQLLRSFDLNIPRIPVNETHIKKCRDNEWAELNDRDESTMNSRNKYLYNLKKKALKKLDFSTLFNMYLPLYKEIHVDSEGNFLVFKFSICRKNCDPVIQVYSKEGTFICETRLDSGKYDFGVDQRWQNLRFTTDGIFGIFMEKGDEEENLRLIKSSYSPMP